MYNDGEKNAALNRIQNHDHQNSSCIPWSNYLSVNLIMKYNSVIPTIISRFVTCVSYLFYITLHHHLMLAAE